MNHAWDLICYELVALLADGKIHTYLTLDSLTGPFLAPCRPHKEDSPMPYPAATPRDAIEASFGNTLGSTFKVITGQEWTEDDACLTVCLHAFTLLSTPRPQQQTIAEITLSSLRGQWQKYGLTFPKGMQIVLLHSVDITNRLVFTGHAGILLKTTTATPILRREVVVRCYAGCQRYRRSGNLRQHDRIVHKPRATICPSTVNDATIKPVPRQPIPLRNENGEIITGKPNRLAEIDP